MSGRGEIRCNVCGKQGFTGLHYRCLLCDDYDICEVCYHRGVIVEQHSTRHAVQCVPSRADADLYYRGEMRGGAPLAQSFTCPICALPGFTAVTLRDHVQSTHADTHNMHDVRCPICAALSLCHVFSHNLLCHIEQQHQPLIMESRRYAQAIQNRMEASLDPHTSSTGAAARRGAIDAASATEHSHSEELLTVQEFLAATHRGVNAYRGCDAGRGLSGMSYDREDQGRGGDSARVNPMGRAIRGSGVSRSAARSDVWIPGEPFYPGWDFSTGPSAGPSGGPSSGSGPSGVGPSDDPNGGAGSNGSAGTNGGPNDGAGPSRGAGPNVGPSGGADLNDSPSGGAGSNNGPSGIAGPNGGPTGEGPNGGASGGADPNGGPSGGAGPNDSYGGGAGSSGVAGSNGGSNADAGPTDDSNGGPSGAAGPIGGAGQSGGRSGGACPSGGAVARRVRHPASNEPCGTNRGARSQPANQQGTASNARPAVTENMQALSAVFDRMMEKLDSSMVREPGWVGKAFGQCGGDGERSASERWKTIRQVATEGPIAHDSSSQPTPEAFPIYPYRRSTWKCSRLHELRHSEQSQERLEVERACRSLFVQELILDFMQLPTTTDDSHSAEQDKQADDSHSTEQDKQADDSHSAEQDK